MKDTLSVLILLAHGARDASWALPFERVQQMIVQQQQQQPELRVSLAFLELMQPNLITLVDQLVIEGVNQISIVPLFLGQGAHLRRDVPVLIRQIQQQYPALKITVAQAAGEQLAVLQAMADYSISTLSLR